MVLRWRSWDHHCAKMLRGRWWLGFWWGGDGGDDKGRVVRARRRSRERSLEEVAGEYRMWVKLPRSGRLPYGPNSTAILARRALPPDGGDLDDFVPVVVAVVVVEVVIVVPISFCQQRTARVRRAGRQQHTMAVLDSISVQMSAGMLPKVGSCTLFALPRSMTIRTMDAAMTNAPRAKTDTRPSFVLCPMWSVRIRPIGKMKTFHTCQLRGGCF